MKPLGEFIVVMFVIFGLSRLCLAEPVGTPAPVGGGGAAGCFGRSSDWPTRSINSWPSGWKARTARSCQRVQPPTTLRFHSPGHARYLGKISRPSPICMSFWTIRRRTSSGLTRRAAARKPACVTHFSNVWHAVMLPGPTTTCNCAPGSGLRSLAHKQFPSLPVSMPWYAGNPDHCPVDPSLAPAPRFQPQSDVTPVRILPGNKTTQTRELGGGDGPACF